MNTVANHSGYRSIDLSAPEGKKSLDVTDDFDRATSLSYTSHSRTPLNTANSPHPAQSTTSIPLPSFPGASVPNYSQTQVVEGLPPQGYYEQQQQQQQQPQPTQNNHQQRPVHSSRNSSWDMLGGARKFGQAYEQFDPRNASEQHLVFADGDLPNSKVSFYLYSIDTCGY